MKRYKSSIVSKGIYTGMKYSTNSLNFWKIICTYMIVILHYGYSAGWKLAVEFFFIVSGIMMAYEYTEKRTSYCEYIKKRIWRLWPHYIFSFLVYIIVATVRLGEGREQLVTEIKHSVLEIFMLQILGLGDYASNHGAEWYVSSLFVASIVLYAILQIYGTKVLRRHLCFILCIIGGFCSQFIFGEMCIINYESRFGLCSIPGLIRGISEMSIGVQCYYVGEWLSNKGYFKRCRGLWIGLELSIMVITIIYTFYRLDRHVLVISFFTIVAGLGLFVEHNKKFCYVTNKFSRYTYPIYLNHPLYIDFFKKDLGLSLWIVLVVVTLYSMVTVEIVDAIKNIFTRSFLYNSSIGNSKKEG